MSVTIQATAGTIPDQFVGNLQELFTLFAANLQFTINGSLVGIQFGGAMPTSDVGPWLPAGSNVFWFYSSTAGKYLPSANVPTGTITEYGSVNPPTGWINCDGSVVSQSIYPALFTVIAYQFSLVGSDGTQTADTNSLTAASQFRLPDFRGRFPLGQGQGTPNATTGTNTLTLRTMGQRGGQESVTLKQANLPDPIKLEASEYDSAGNQATPALYGGTKYSVAPSEIDVTNPSATSTDTGNVPPFAVVNFIIRT